MAGNFVDRFRQNKPKTVTSGVDGALPDQTVESPLDGGKQQDTPYAEDGGGGGLLSPVDSGDANPPPVDGIWAGDTGEQRGGDDNGGIEPPIGPPHPPIDPDTGEPIPTPPTPPTPTTPTPSNDLGPSIAARLKDIFGQGLSPSATDPSLRGAINASRVSGQRNLERQRAILAERAGIEGTNDSGGFDTQLMGLAQDQGEKDRAFEGNLLANEGNNRVQQIMQALQLASGNQNQNNQLGLSYAQLLALLNSQALSTELNGA